jgi:multimeric flavodoxin WrbA
MGTILIVNYSLTGNTRDVARQIAGILRADRVEIADLKDRNSASGLFRTLWEMLAGAEPEISVPAHDPGSYDLVVLACPVWMGAPASPMRRYLSRQAQACRRVAFVLTCGGSGAARAFARLEAQAGRAPEARLEVTTGELKSGAATHKIAAFAHLVAQVAEGGGDAYSGPGGRPAAADAAAMKPPK